MILKLFLVVTVLFKVQDIHQIFTSLTLNRFQTLNADVVTESDGNATVSIANVWKSQKKTKECCQCDCTPDWVEGVQEYFDGTSEAAKNFPSGEPLELADAVMTSFQDFLTKLVSFSDSNSTVLSTSSTAILGALSKLNKLASSANTIIEEFDKVLPDLVETYKGVVSNLTNIIGELTCPVNHAMSELECSLQHYIKEFSQSDALGRRKVVPFDPVMKCVQILTNTIAFIAETTIDQCELATPDVQDALAVLSLILDHLSICVQGINACSQAILSEQKCEVPVVLRISFVTMDSFISGINRSVASITFPIAESITAFLRNLVNLTNSLNTSLNDLLGLFEGVSLTVGQITKNLSKNVSGTVRGITNRLTNFLRGIAAINK